MYSGEILLLAVMVAVVVGIALYARAIAKMMPAPRVGPKGIGGWLILPAISLVLGPIGTLYALSQLAGLLGEVEPGSVVYTILLFEAVAQGTIGAFAIFVAFQFFSLSRLAPGLMIALLGGIAAFAVVDNVIITIAASYPIFNDVTVGSLLGAMLSALIWIPYFYVSVRVRNTFVR